MIDDDPFIIGDLPPGAVESGWRHGRALAVRRLPPMNRPLSMLLLGPVEDLHELVAQLLTRGALNDVHGVTTERHALEPVADQLRSAGVEVGTGGDWDWMWTSTQPVICPGEEQVVELDEDTDLEAIRLITNEGVGRGGASLAG